MVVGGGGACNNVVHCANIARGHCRMQIILARGLQKGDKRVSFLGHDASLGVVGVVVDMLFLLFFLFAKSVTQTV